MKQIIQSLKTGVTEVAEVPYPSIQPGYLLIRSQCSLISTGTERMLMNFGKAGPVGKMRQQPDKVRMVVEKIKSDGLIPTFKSVNAKLEQPISLGYCNVGIVEGFGGVQSSISIGDRVVSNGAHAEMVNVPFNLCAKIPDKVSNEAAVFTVLGSIALQGIRLINPTLGEAVVVMGLGPVGQMAVQLLLANGCRVLAVDFNSDRLAIVKNFGAEVVNLGNGEELIEAAENFSRGRGVDAVLIATATGSSDPIHQAATICRKRGRIVLVGVAGLDLIREDFFKKELTFQVSASYGPGRYDQSYEERGIDYPVGFVRWTEQRNFEAVLDMMASGKLNLEPLISHKFPIEKGNLAYELIGGNLPSMGVLLTYSGLDSGAQNRSDEQSIWLSSKGLPKNNIAKKFPEIAFIGAGNYATSVLMPAFRRTKASLRMVATKGGVNGIAAGRKFGFMEATTDLAKIFQNKEIDSIIIATRHNNHAELVLEGIGAGKHVFVEKPLCINLEQLNMIQNAYQNCAKQSIFAPRLMVGFNRRFSPHAKKIKSLLDLSDSPKSFVMTINAGKIPLDHWTQESVEGGGRIIGEVCHFIDLLRFLSGAKIESWQCVGLKNESKDTASINLTFADGSIGSIHYFSNGNKSFPKESLDIYVGGRILKLNNFRFLTGYGWPNFKKLHLWSQNKGQAECAKAFIDSLSDGGPPIMIDEIFEVARVTIEIAESLK